MQLTVSEKIKIILGRRNMTQTDLADRLGITRQNLANKIKRNNFSEKEIHDMADALNCKFEPQFVLLDTDETI